MIETVFNQKHDVALLSHKITSKDKEMTRGSKIRVKYKETKRDPKVPVKCKETKRRMKNDNALKTKIQG